MNLFWQSVKQTFSLRNTWKELKEAPKSAKLMGLFLFAGITAYYFLVGDFSFWGNLAIVGLYFSAINLVLVDAGKITSYSWGIYTSICATIGAFHYSMYGDFAYYLWVFPWMFIGMYTWYKLSLENSSDTTESLSLPRKHIPAYIVLFIAAYVIMLGISTFFGGAVPWVDSFILAFGVIGQVFLSKSYKEQWIIWICQNVTALTAWGFRLNMALALGESIVYPLSMIVNWSIFLINAIYGCYSWYKNSK